MKMTATRKHQVSGVWGNSKSMRSELIADGWVTPDTYGNAFGLIVDEPAVYLFLLYQADTYEKSLIAYVGMSICLRQRMTGHNILPLLHTKGFWPMRWFKRTPEADLRAVEREYITRFNPPWNIACCPRGVLL